MNLSTSHRHSMNRTAHAVALSCAGVMADLYWSCERNTTLEMGTEMGNINSGFNNNGFSGKFNSKISDTSIGVLGFGGEDDEE